MKAKRKRSLPLARLSDFEGRARANPGNVIENKKRGWRYIPVHPMADEKEVLEKLGLKPESCSKVDCYWNIGRDVVFLQVISRSRWDYHPTGLYARLSSTKPPMLYLVAVTKSSQVSRRLVEDAMNRFVKLGLSGSKVGGVKPTDRLTRIGNLSPKLLHASVGRQSRRVSRPSPRRPGISSR